MLQNQLLEQSSGDGSSSNQSGQLMGNQSLLTAASLASALGMQLSTLTSPPASASQAPMTTGGGGRVSSAHTMMVCEMTFPWHFVKSHGPAYIFKPCGTLSPLSKYFCDGAFSLVTAVTLCVSVITMILQPSAIKTSFNDV